MFLKMWNAALALLILSLLQPMSLLVSPLHYTTCIYERFDLFKPLSLSFEHDWSLTSDSKSQELGFFVLIFSPTCAEIRARYVVLSGICRWL